MVWLGALYTVALVVAAAAPVGLSVYIWQHHRTPAVKTLTVALLGGSGWIVCCTLALVSSSKESGVFWIKMGYIPLTIIYVTWFFFVLQYAEQEKLLTRRSLALFSIIPTITVMLVLTSKYHSLMDTYTTLVRDGGLFLADFSIRPGIRVHTVYAQALFLFSDFLLIRMLVRAGHFYRRQIVSLLLASVLFQIMSLLYMFVLPLSLYSLTTVILFYTACSALAFSTYKFQIADIIPVARGAIIEGMRDGVMVLDAQNRILDVNPLMQQLMGRPAPQLIGHSVEDVWPPWAGRIITSKIEMGKEIVLNLCDVQHTYDVCISPLSDWRGNLVSQIVVLRDISDRKKAETQLRKLFEASKLINSTMDSNEIFTFISDSCQELVGFDNFMIFLVLNNRIYPVYVLGKIEDLVEGVILECGEGLVGTCIESRETLVLDDAHKDPRGKVIGTLEMRSQIIVPLIIEDNCVGALHISKAAEGAYDQGDVDILKPLSEVVSSAIRNSNLYNEIKKFGEELEERIKKRSEKIETLLNARQNLQKETSLERGLTTIVDSMERLGFDRVGVFLIDPGKEKLNFHMGRGVDLPDIYTSISLKRKEYICVQCVTEKKTIHVKDSRLIEGIQIVHAQSFVWVPIVVQDESFAALAASNIRENCVTEEDVKDLEILAGMCAAFIDRTRILIEPATERASKSKIKYQLDPMETYIVLEKKSEKSFEIFVDLVTHGMPGFLISREYPEKIKKKYNLLKTPMLWLSRSERENTIIPDDLPKLSYVVEDFTRKSQESVILMDGFEYLVTQNGFEIVLKFLQELKDIISLNNSRLIIPVHRETVSSKELGNLEKEFTILER